MMTLYLAGPMTGIADFNYPAFSAAAVELRRSGYLVECPSENDLPPGMEWHRYLRHAIKRMLNCDAIAVLPGWEHSKGAQLEVLIAERLGMQVKTVLEWMP